jgi:hypothetical protein
MVRIAVSPKALLAVFAASVGCLAIMHAAHADTLSPDKAIPLIQEAVDIDKDPIMYCPQTADQSLCAKERHAMTGGSWDFFGYVTAYDYVDGQ